MWYTPEWRHWHHPDAFVVNFGHISQPILVFLLLTLNRCLFKGKQTNSNKWILLRVTKKGNCINKKTFFCWHKAIFFNVIKNKTEVIVTALYVVQMLFNKTSVKAWSITFLRRFRTQPGNKNGTFLAKILTLHKKWSFSLWISLVIVTKSAVSCGFGHIYWRNS